MFTEHVAPLQRHAIGECLAVSLLLSITACTVPKKASTTPPEAAISAPTFCADPYAVSALDDADADRLWSMCYAWYRNNPNTALDDIATGGDGRWTAACATALGNDGGSEPSDVETEYFASALGVTGPQSDKAAICHFAILDQDDDGILDYRISNAGRFTENDDDVDGDGVRNVRDVDPVDPLRGRAARCGRGPFPAHLALACGEECEQGRRFQRELYAHYDLVVVNRDFPPADPRIIRNVAVLRDAVHLFYGDNFARHPFHDPACRGLSSLKTVAFEQCVVLRHAPGADSTTVRASCKDEDEWVTSAEAHAHNASVVFYTPGLKLPGVLALGTFVHELAHSWTFAYDYDDGKRRHLLRENYWQAPVFKTVLREFGWTIEDLPPETIDEQRAWFDRIVSTPHEIIEYDDTTYLLNGIPVAQHLEELEAGEWTQLMYSPHASEYGLIGTYSLSSPWEWFPEAVQAYLFRSLEDHVGRYGPAHVGQQTRDLFRAHVIEEWEKATYHGNLLDEDFARLQKMFPLSDAALDELTCRYIVYSDDFVFMPMEYYVSAEADAIDVGALKMQVREAWQDVCSSYERLPHDPT